jgi:hypothetical protein
MQFAPAVAEQARSHLPIGIAREIRKLPVPAVDAPFWEDEG